jgi:tetrahydromethanopterin S-methyltransferase subunit E
VPTGAALMGASPSATLVNVVTLFQAFFQSFGALVVFFALVSWRSVVNGQTNRSQMGCVVQFVFGIMLINILAITNALIGMFA